MVNINKFTNFKRLDLKNIHVIFGYFSIKIRPNLNERSVFNYYNVDKLKWLSFEET
jgi:hypothetical protein